MIPDSFVGGITARPCVIGSSNKKKLNTGKVKIAYFIRSKEMSDGSVLVNSRPFTSSG